MVRISQNFGTTNFAKQSGYYKNNFHSGIDITDISGDARSPIGGKVVFVGEDTGFGGTVKVQAPDGKIYRFSHLKAFNVQPGQEITQGTSVGTIGGGPNDPMRGTSTGSHLHFGVYQDGQALDPTNYLDFFKTQTMATPTDQNQIYDQIANSLLGSISGTSMSSPDYMGTLDALQQANAQRQAQLAPVYQGLTDVGQALAANTANTVAVRDAIAKYIAQQAGNYQEPLAQRARAISEAPGAFTEALANKELANRFLTTEGAYSPAILNAAYQMAQPKIQAAQMTTDVVDQLLNTASDLVNRGTAAYQAQNQGLGMLGDVYSQQANWINQDAQTLMDILKLKPGYQQAALENQLSLLQAAQGLQDYQTGTRFASGIANPIFDELGIINREEYVTSNATVPMKQLDIAKLDSILSNPATLDTIFAGKTRETSIGSLQQIRKKLASGAQLTPDETAELASIGAIKEISDLDVQKYLGSGQASKQAIEAYPDFQSLLSGLSKQQIAQETASVGLQQRQDLQLETLTNNYLKNVLKDTEKLTESLSKERVTPLVNANFLNTSNPDLGVVYLEARKTQDGKGIDPGSFGYTLTPVNAADYENSLAGNGVKETNSALGNVEAIRYKTSNPAIDIIMVESMSGAPVFFRQDNYYGDNALNAIKSRLEQASSYLAGSTSSLVSTAKTIT